MFNSRFRRSALPAVLLTVMMAPLAFPSPAHAQSDEDQSKATRDETPVRARIDNALQPGEPGFRLRNIALGTPMLVKGLRIDGKPSCAVREELAW